MKLLRINFTLAMAMLLWAGNASAAAAPKRVQKGRARTEVRAKLHSTADTIEVMSAKMGRAIKNVVIVPEVYYNRYVPNDRYPVVYLLHGANGDYSNWPRKKNLHELADRYGVIFVCPDGQDSWYFDSPIDPKMQFETYISSELLSYIDLHYRT